MSDIKKSNVSGQWERINRLHFTDEALADLANFKSSAVNHKLAVWNPQSNGVRYLKELTHNLCHCLKPKDWELLDNIKGRDLGNPYTVSFNGRRVCLDYLQSIFEVGAIQQAFVPLAGADVLEIGAGYGRTCHALISNHNLSAYTIVDLEKTLVLASTYLKEVLSREQYSLVNFVNAEDIDKLTSCSYTLAINIDSFAEMPEEIVRSYLKLINTTCQWCYVKNPVGKYLDPSLDMHNDGSEAVQLALSSGILRDIIDIHDNLIVERQSQKFLKEYSPSKDWKLVSESWARPWSYYWQAIYKKRN
jgi:putative sugar O-methyltransferase